jgi:hypothetical protein
MPRVIDALAGETIYRHETWEMCEIECSRLGGNEKRYFVLSDELSLTKNINESNMKIVEKKPAIGELFG